MHSNITVSDNASANQRPLHSCKRIHLSSPQLPTSPLVFFIPLPGTRRISPPDVPKERFCRLSGLFHLMSQAWSETVLSSEISCNCKFAAVSEISRSSAANRSQEFCRTSVPPQSTRQGWERNGKERTIQRAIGMNQMSLGLFPHKAS